MKKFISSLFLPALLVLMTVMVSCSDDDQETYQDPPSDINYPYTNEYAGTPSNTFAMYTNGDSVNTDTLDYNDYVDGDVSATFSDSVNSALTLTFTADSVFVGTEGLPYYSQNDSLFIEYTFIENGDTILVNYLLGEGTPNNLTITNSYVEHCVNGAASCSTLAASTEQSLESVASSEDIPISTLEDILAGDTLMIINQKVLYQ